MSQATEHDLEISARIEALQRQLKEAEAQRDALQKARKRQAIDEVRELVATHGLEWREVVPPSIIRELSGAPAAPSGLTRQSIKPRGINSEGKKIPAKYRDLQGNTWSGRGLQPQWVKDAIASGVALEDLRIR